MKKLLINKENAIKYLVIVTIILSLYQDLLQNYIKICTYSDEIYMVSLGILLVVFLLKKKVALDKYDKILIISLSLFIIIGFLGIYIYKYATFFVAFKSAIVTLKGYIIYLSSKNILGLVKGKKDVLRSAYLLSKFSLILFTIIGILNLNFNFLKTSGKRFGINTVSIGFSHVTELAFFTLACLSIVIFYYQYNKIKSLPIMEVICSSILILLTGRTKSIVFFILFIAFSVAYIISKSTSRKIRFRYILIILPILILVSAPRIKSEFFEGPRGILYENAIKIADESFPIGSGFGTYGSDMSRKNYSPLYYKFKINNIRGFSLENNTFITDTYWAMILGENGWLGVLLILLILISIILSFVKLKVDNEIKFAAYILIGYSLMTSIAEPIYSSNKCFNLFFLLAFYFNLIKEYKCLEKLNEKDNIIIVTWQQFGYHTDTFQYCKYLKNDVKITFICFDEGLKHIYNNDINIKYIKLLNSKLLNRLAIFSFVIFYTIKLNSKIVFIKYFKGCSLLTKLLKNYNLVLDIRTATVIKELELREKYDKLITKESKLFKNITVISDGVANRLNIKSFKLLPLGGETFNNLEDKKVSFDKLDMIYVGTFDNRKIEDTIKGVIRLSEKYGKDKFTYTIIGFASNKDEEENIKFLIEENKFANINFLGRIDNDKLGEYFKECNIGISYIPKTDYFNYQPPTKTYEYLFNGLYTIATSTYENKKIINDFNGILIEDNESDFVAKVEKLINNVNLEITRKKIVKSVERYSWENISKNLFDYFKSII